MESADPLTSIGLDQLLQQRRERRRLAAALRAGTFQTPRQRWMLLFRRAGRPSETASLFYFLVLDRVRVNLEAPSGVVPNRVRPRIFCGRRATPSGVCENGNCRETTATPADAGAHR